MFKVDWFRDRLKPSRKLKLRKIPNPHLTDFNVVQVVAITGPTRTNLTRRCRATVMILLLAILTRTTLPILNTIRRCLEQVNIATATRPTLIPLLALIIRWPIHRPRVTLATRVKTSTRQCELITWQAVGLEWRHNLDKDRRMLSGNYSKS
jgi:hypothetical protein